MCGIFGLITTNELDVVNKNYLKVVNYLFKLSESRGKEASGFITKSEKNIDYYKTPESASKMIKSREYFNHFNKLKMPISIIGHSRLVTNGTQENHDNNQPIMSQGIVGVHNGIITNVNELWNTYKMIEREHEIDTEIIFKLLTYYINKSSSLESAVGLTFSKLLGTASIASFFSNINKALIATNNGSLYIAYDTEKKICVFTSEMFTLRMVTDKILSLKMGKNLEIHKVEPGQAYTIDLSTFDINKFSYASKVQRPQLDFKEPTLITDITPKFKRNVKNSGSGYFNVKSVRLTIPNDFKKNYYKKYEVINNIKRCNKCILPETFPFIIFDDFGVCNFCKNTENSTLKGNESKLSSILETYKKGSNQPDCIIPFSGGRDSSYGLFYLKQKMGMNPITYTYDWGMVTDLARRNIARMCGSLGVENIIVSADIRKKRNNIKKNVIAWLKKPNLGIIPLFMAGDKQFFHFVNKIKKQTGIDLNIWMPNSLEETSFKYGFCGIQPDFFKHRIDYLSASKKISLLKYYGKNFFFNLNYFNWGLIDTLWAFHSYYFEKRTDYFSLFDFIKWDEKTIEKTLLNQFDWEISPDTNTTWRIGDGTAPFYNYIYYMVAGFSENDTFRSNQIRRAMITRQEAINKTKDENRPRWNEIKWYCDTIGIDFQETIKIINKIPQLYKT